ncbi:MAG: putative DCC family thiol-disulfide oxidoreductase YuxK [Halioglobus sp.]|jgi:predicted DCC family thiol-disulfide oxidoreductase YuxK
MKKCTKSELIAISHTHPIIAFDGVCNLCDGFVQWLMKRDHGKMFRYVTLQSKAGEVLLSASEKDKETVVLAYKGTLYTYSDVGLQSMKILGGGWKVFAYLSILPKGFRDTVYHFIARNRYKWFGKKEECMVPSVENRELFL